MMGRIDEALLRAGTEDRTAAVPAPTESRTDVFTSPWAFSEEPVTEIDARPPALAAPAVVAPGETDAPALEVALPRDGRSGVFQGFSSELEGRIVAAPGASPMLSEQFRRLAATLHHAQLVQGTKVVMITSANPADGKTLTATNLALTLSESYRRQVLLVDADLRRPSLHEVFRVPNVVGLNEGLKASHDAKLQVLKITDTLTLLPAGRPDPDPMSSLTSTRMGEILKEGAARFDWVIVDTAPIGLLADANLLSTMVDGALLVVRAHQTPYAAVSKALENLGRDRVLGVVLNATEGGAAQHHEYYGRYSTTAPDATTLAKTD
jgi:protein-tyrosine kinase